MCENSAKPIIIFLVSIVDEDRAPTSETVKACVQTKTGRRASKLGRRRCVTPCTHSEHGRPACRENNANEIR